MANYKNFYIPLSKKEKDWLHVNIANLEHDDLMWVSLEIDVAVCKIENDFIADNQKNIKEFRVSVKCLSCLHNDHLSLSEQPDQDLTYVIGMIFQNKHCSKCKIIGLLQITNKTEILK